VIQWFPTGWFRAPESYWRGGEGKGLLMDVTGNGGGPALSLEVVTEVVRAAVDRSSPQAALRAVIDMAVTSGPCDAAASPCSARTGC
jgi:hypothetical protein